MEIVLTKLAANLVSTLIFGIVVSFAFLIWKKLSDKSLNSKFRVENEALQAMTKQYGRLPLSLEISPVLSKIKQGNMPKDQWSELFNASRVKDEEVLRDIFTTI